MAALPQTLPSDEFSLVENGAIAGRYLAKFWQPIGLSEASKPGKAKRIKILGEHYTLYRGEEGTINLVQDRCPHRGTSLAYGWVEGTSIRCRYRPSRILTGYTPAPCPLLLRSQKSSRQSSRAFPILLSR